MKRPLQSVSGRCARRSVKVAGFGAMLAMVAVVAGAKHPATAAIPACEMQVLVTVAQAAQRFPGEVIPPDDFEVAVGLDGDGIMDAVYLSCVSSMPPGACRISEADCEYNQRDVGNLSLMILDTSIGRTPAVLGCGLGGVAVAAGPYGVRSLYCNENELRWNLGEYVWIDQISDADE